jgi:L-2,4-diaminobutyrate decarboxylase
MAASVDRTARDLGVQSPNPPVPLPWTNRIGAIRMQGNETAIFERGLEPRGAESSLRLPRSHLAGSDFGLQSLAFMLANVVERVQRARGAAGPLASGTTESVLLSARNELGAFELPVDGIGCEAAVERVARALFLHGVDLAHPNAAAHLQPPPLAVSVVADALASASNASLDTFDSGPSAIAIERWLLLALARLARLGPEADGVMTPGGSMSNLLGLLLARDAAAWRRGIDARREGVRAMGRPVVLCSELAHFSVNRACAALGLGEDAVRPVAVDERRRMNVVELAQALRALDHRQVPIAIVATAGTTDFGSVDPLDPIADLAREHRVWLHVDAAYGFGALFSETLSSRMASIERADSITLDLHKLGWQPAAASVLLVADGRSFAALDREVAYLNPSDDAEAGYDGLLGRSLQTTRRPDATKVAATLLAYGTRGIGRMVEACHALARHAERRIASEPLLELVAPAELTTVVFRYRGCSAVPEAAFPDAEAFRDGVNGHLRRRLLEGGIALLGRTATPLARGAEPRVCLKLTLLNPCTEAADVDRMIDAVLLTGRACEDQLVGLGLDRDAEPRSTGGHS